MKNRDILSLVDDKYIDEANPAKAKREKVKRRRTAIVSLAACMFLALGLWLFMPVKNFDADVSEYRDSEYYRVISTINDINYAARYGRYKNNFERHFLHLFNQSSEENSMTNGGIPDYGGGMDSVEIMPSEDVYQETTDNQVEGVKEGDLIKRSDKYIFYYDIKYKVIRVYSIEGENSREISAFYIESVKPGLRAASGDEMYLSEDCRTLTVILNVPFSYGEYAVLSLDVSDVTDIKVKKTVNIKGTCISSRVVDGVLILVSKYSVQSDVDFDNPEEYVPAVDTGNGMELVSSEDIMVSPNSHTLKYTVVSCFTEDGLEKIGTVALMSFGSIVYVSRDNIYVCMNYYEKNILGNRTRYTEIASIKYSREDLKINGAVSVEGIVNNQYSMDEYGGYLRVVTSTEESASLYCISLEDYKIKGKVENFAPKGEDVKSARFKENTAYVCTSIAFRDPVFFFDLTDIKNITYKQTDEIPGFSTSLIDFGEGYLLGVGRDGIGASKIEIYVEGEEDIEVLCNYIVSDGSINSDYKSYYINRGEYLFGVHIHRYKAEDADRYMLLYFDGSVIKEKAVVYMTAGVNNPRAVIIDGYMYLFGENHFSLTRVDG